MEINDYASDILKLKVTNVTNVSRFHVKNEVYKIDAGNKTFIMKIFLDEDRYEKSENEWKVLSEYGIKLNIIPKSVLIDRSEKYFKGPVIFREFVEGLELKSEIKRRVAENQDCKDILQQSLAAIKMLHELNISKNDFILTSHQNKFEKLFKTNIDYFKNNLRGYMKIFNEYIRKRQQLKLNNFSFCHGDLGGHQIILIEKNLTSIIDWENACFFDPACDYGYFTFSLINGLYKNQDKVEEMYSFLKRNIDLENFDFFVAERAIGTSSIYYVKEKPDKCDWAMKFAGNILTNL